MNRLRFDLLRRANGALLQQFFSNEAAPSFREPPARQVTAPRFPTSRYQPRLEDPAETIRHIAMNPVAILNHMKYDNENEYIYKYIHNKLKEHYTPANTHLPFHSQIQELLRLVAGDQNQSRIREICELVRSRLQDLNIDQLEMLLTLLAGHYHDEIRHTIRVIDLRLNWCIKNDKTVRLSRNLDRWLYIADLLYESRVRSVYNRTLTSLLARDIQETDVCNRQILHLLFLIILERQSNYLLPKFQRRIFSLLGEATIEDLSIICLAYFKTRTLITNKDMLDKIISQTTKNLSTLDPQQPAYCSIVKSVRYSRDPGNREEVVKLITKLLGDPEHKIMFGSPYNAVHTIKLMEAYRIYEPRMLHILRCLIFKDLGNFRIKDIQYALTSLSNLTYMDLKIDDSLKADFDSLLDNIVSGSREDVYHQNYHLIPIIRALALFGYCSPKIISYAVQVLSDRAQVAKMSGVLEFEKSTLLVHATSAIEHGDTSLLQVKPLLDHCSSTIQRIGNSGSVKQDLSLSHLNFVLRRHQRRQQPNSAMFLSIAEALANHDDLRNEPYSFNFQYTFPHQNYSDLVITRDGPEPGSFDPETLLPRPVPTQARPCVVFATQKTDMIDRESRLCGYKQTLIRLMTRMGYFVLQVDLHQPDINDLAHRVKTILSN